MGSRRLPRLWANASAGRMQARTSESPRKWKKPQGLQAPSGACTGAGSRGLPEGRRDQGPGSSGSPGRAPATAALGTRDRPQTTLRQCDKTSRGRTEERVREQAGAEVAALGVCDCINIYA